MIGLQHVLQKQVKVINLINFQEIKSHKANLFLDTTGSIGLEEGHELADLVAFSSCKGLLGLTGGSREKK